MPETMSFLVPPEADGERLDKWLSRQDSLGLTRSSLQKGYCDAWYQLCLYHGSTPWQICARSAESGYAVPVPGTAGSGILTGTG